MYVGKKVLHSWICKTSLSGWKLRCEIFAKISISSPYNPKKKSSEKKMFKTKVVDNFTLYLANFFYFDEIAKMWVWQPKMSCWVLSEVIFWPKFLQINRALSKLFMHMKTHFSSISFNLDLSFCNFFLWTTLMYSGTRMYGPIYKVFSMKKNMEV